MKALSETHRVHYQDRMVVVWYPLATHGKIYRQGKRVPADFPLTVEERRFWVKGDLAAAIKSIKERLGLSLADAMEFFKKAQHHAK